MSPSAAAPSIGIGDRVQQHVGVGVPEQAPLVRNLHAADHEPSARNQRVHVEALPHPDLHAVLPV